MSPVVTVFGVTGIIGGSVARSLAQDHKVRGVTRDANSPAAEHLTRCGIQVVQADPSDPKSLREALGGAVACFVVTNCNFSEPQCSQKEVEQGKAIADACAHLGVGHVVYSTQLSVVKVSGMSARHMDAKAEIENYMKHLGLPLTCIIVPRCCYESFLEEPLRPRRTGPMNYDIQIPTGHVPLDTISANDVGPVVKQIFADKRAFLNKTLSLSGSKLTVKEMAGTLVKHIPGLSVKDKQVTVSDYRKARYPGAEDMASMFDFYIRVDQRASIDLTKKLNPNVQSFDQWVWSNSGAITQALEYPATPLAHSWAAL